MNLAKGNELVEKDNRPARGRGGKYNFPSAVDPASESAADISEALTEVCRCWDKGMTRRPETDDEIYQASCDYFDECIRLGKRPTVEKYCLYLGYARQTVCEWKLGKSRSARLTDIIKRAYDVFAAFDAEMVSNGKLNAVLYFFRAKNYYDMQDQAQVQLVASAPMDARSADDIVADYKDVVDVPEDD